MITLIYLYEIIESNGKENGFSKGGIDWKEGVERVYVVRG